MKNKIIYGLLAIVIITFLLPANFVSAENAEKDNKSAVSSENTNTTAALQELVWQLQKQIQDLQDQLSKMKVEVEEVKEAMKLTKTLYKGLSDEEVKEIQKFLSQYHEIYPEGLITGYFGPLTEKAIKKFQEQNDIPATGTVGPMTREKINESLAKEEKEEKLTICHIPPGNPIAEQTITIGKSALDAHLAHGDVMGSCSEPVQPKLKPTPTPTPVEQVPITPKSAVTLPPVSTPIASLTKIGPVAKLEAGSFHTCAIMTDKSLYCWGMNDKGQLGNNSLGSSNLAVAVFGLDTNVSAVAGGRGHTCALKTDGSVLCWGSNYNGQLGDGTFVDKPKPNPVPSLGPGTTIAISAGENHTCALRSDKSVVCWGDNNEGQIGDGATEGRLVPTPVNGLGAGSTSFISLGPRNSCAVKTDGSLVCWGSINFFSKNTNHTIKITDPFLISDFDAGTISSVAVDHFQICVVRIDGSVACAGSNSAGELGNGTTTSSLVTPVMVYGLGAGTSAAVSTGREFSCGLRLDGSVLCWGWNAYSQLGDGTVTNRYLPTSVAGLTAGTIIAITSGDSHSCGIKNDGTVVCWGLNGSGQLGDSTYVDKRFPVAVTITVASTAGCGDVTGSLDLIAPIQQQINELLKKPKTAEIVAQIAALQKQIDCIKLLHQ